MLLLPREVIVSFCEIKAALLKNLLIISLLISSTQALAAEVTLYAITSPRTLDWRTPKSLLISTMRNYAKRGSGVASRHKIGHAYLGFKCDGQNEVISGMTSGPGFGAKQSIFKEKIGLSVMLRDNPGAFQDHQESLRDIQDFTNSSRINALKVKITNEECLDLQAWHTEYSGQKKFIYGGVDKRPLKGEGAGCTAYAMSFFEHGNIDFKFFNSKFLRTIYMPLELVGGDEGGNRKVPVTTILGDKTNMALASANALRVDLYDPNDMFSWIQKQWLEFEKSGKAEELKNYNINTSIQNKMRILTLTPRN